MGDEAFGKLLENSVREVVSLQENTGMTAVTSRLLTWHDLLSPLRCGVSWLKPRRLLRSFDNNPYHRHPAMIGQIGWREPITVDEVRRVKRHISRIVKAVIPGSYTYLKLLG